MNAFVQPQLAEPAAGSARRPPGLIHVAHPLGLEETDLTRCLAALLGLLGWQGGPEEILAALPHAVARPDLTDIRNALARLGHPTRPQRLRAGTLDLRCLPALLLRRGQPAVILYRGAAGDLLLFDGASGLTRAAQSRSLAGTLYVPVPPDPPRPRESWVGAVARRFAPALPLLLGLSTLVTLLGLAVPIFTMLVFDIVVTGRQVDALGMLLAGVLLAVVGEVGVRALRQRALARIGERLDRLVPDAIFGQLLALPAALVERAGTAAQVSRLRDFAGIREMLTGAFALAVLDLPFTLLVLALLLALGGWIAAVPVLAALAFALLFLATRGAAQRAINAASQAGQAREVLAIELLEAHRTLRLAGASERWVAGYAGAAAAAALASARAGALNARITSAAQAIVSLSGLAAISMGVGAVLAEAMSPGALIAGMMLIWRVLTPMQGAFLMLSRWEQTRASIRQVDGMMALETERPARQRALMAEPAHGGVVFHRVALRYLSQAEPVLAGTSFVIRPGEVVAVTGGDGAGKSSLLKLVAGLYRPQAGVVRVGGHDVRAYDPAVLRRAVAYVPQTPQMLYGTIAQNLRLAAPDATEDALRRACAEAHALAAIEALPHGLETRLGDNAGGNLPRSLLVRLCLARALLRDAPVLLLDEPVAGLDETAAAAFAAVIGARRGRATILMATHRPSHMRLADRVLRIADATVEEVPPPGAAPSAAPLRLPVFKHAGRPT
ncbi:peptidase domain-containing ABC transporter [Falsiroseomonas oryzae]|uniref:peptidase domain-containing ABC transporter n=1 Tax=Falsiroseomonas oryzae TaxID=2766473 RepID=UPI0022EAFE0E|nr:ATP-binding cassette domain-containing protein [Roseomonas sp. MO-31]